MADWFAALALRLLPTPNPNINRGRNRRAIAIKIEKTINMTTADPRRNNVEGFIAALTILAKYLENGMQTNFFLGAEHDIIYAYVDASVLPEDSEDGQALSALGWFVDGEGWARYV